MRIAIDGTSAAVQTAGVGRYTRELLRSLVTLSHDDRYEILTASDQESATDLARILPPGAWREFRRLPVSERVLTAAWHRLRLPVPVDLFSGDFDVFHGPDFVIPPTRRPTVVTIHDLSYLVAPEYGEPTLVNYLRASVPRSLRRATQIVTVSASVAAEVVEAYPFVSGKVRAIPNGVTVPVGQSRTGKIGRKPLILTVGTIEPRKNHLALLRAMPYIWRHCADAELMIVGRIGWQADDIVRELTVATASSRVSLRHSVSDDELEHLFNEAAVFAFPSHYEGFGLPILEAMARGIPVVASNIPSLRETGGSAARYVNPDDPEELAAVILDLLNNNEERRRLTEAGFQRSTELSWEQTARRTRDTYRGAVEEYRH